MIIIITAYPYNTGSELSFSPPTRSSSPPIVKSDVSVV